LAHDLIAAKRGDWNAKNSLCRTFLPLMTSLIQKRTTETAKQNAMMERAKDGLLKAVKKFHMDQGADKFQIFALNYIETSLDANPKVGFFARLFRK